MDALATAGSLSPLPLSDVWVTGSLRHDLILSSFDDLPADLQEQEKRLRQMVGDRRLVFLTLAAPVGRHEGSTSGFDGEDLEWLLKWAEASHVAVAFQDHTADRARTLSQLLQPLGALHLAPREFPFPEVVMRTTAAMVTDHSQLAADFSATGRPIVSYHSPRPAGSEDRLLYQLPEVLAAEVCPDRMSFRSAVERLFEPHDAERRLADAWKRTLLFEQIDALNARRLVRKVREQSLSEFQPVSKA